MHPEALIPTHDSSRYKPCLLYTSPCKGTRLGSLCFSPVSQRLLPLAELDDYCASLGMKVPGLREYHHGMPHAPDGVFPPGQNLWMSEAMQFNRTMEEMGGVVV